MSESDSFIREVTEEVRQDQMLAYWKKWGIWIISGVVIVVGAAAGWSWLQAQKQAEAEARGAAFIAADPERLEDMTALPGSVDGPAALIAELQAAGALAGEEKWAEAAERYTAIAGREGIASEYRDLALLQAVRARAAGGEADGAAEALAPLAEPGRPFRLLAIELRAALALQAGDTEAAYADLNAIIADPTATADLRRRAAAMITASGGEAPDPA